MKTDMGENMSIDKRELLAALLCITAVFLAIIGGTGCLTSGYHLVDDHWVMRTVINLQSKSILDIAREYIAQDMRIRLRPVYFIMLVIKSYFLKDNLNAWMWWSMLEGISATLAMYMFVRCNGQSRFTATVFSGAIFFGTQFTPWYRALNAENMPAMLYAMLFLLLSLAFHKESRLDNKPWFRIGVSVILGICAFTKESFMIAVPSFVFYVIHLYSRKYDDYKVSSQIIRNLDIILICMMECIIAMYLIIAKIGINSIGYAGIEKSYTLFDYVSRTVISIKNELKLFGCVTLISICVWIVYLVQSSIKDGVWNVVKKNFWIIMAAIAGIVPQFILYARSTMWGRYILPTTILWGGYCVLPALKAAGQSRKKWSGYFLKALLCFMSVWGGFYSAGGARFWGEFGYGTKAIVEEVRNRYQLNGSKDAILLHIDGGEYDKGVETWLAYNLNEAKIVNYRDSSQEMDYSVVVTSIDNYANDASFDELIGGRENYEYEIAYSNFIVMWRKTI